MSLIGYDDSVHDFASGRRKNFETGEKYEKDLEHMKWKMVMHRFHFTPEAPSVVSKSKEGEIYLARLEHNGQLLPGYMRSNGWAYFAYEGQIIMRCSGHELLCDGNVKWHVPHRVAEKDVVVIGHDKDKNPLFFGGFVVNGIELYGEVRKGVCNIAADLGEGWMTILSEPESYGILGLDKSRLYESH
ncbi:Hypothetical predicted protein [Cloeon dipterum]|uniref:Uncharacterized protein n=1 Tax=Cloeon dipterum TaxID=197152 RepID=A0A8S1DQE6_9INSE|nr:Hypothetical predicted protein [Cloeon dipterum]